MSKKATPLISSRYAAMYVPNTTGWDFFDAFAKSPQCQAAFKDSDISTRGKNVDKYLALTAKERLRLYRESLRKDIPQPPQHILELVKIQHPSGKFENLSQVLNILFMPQDVKFRNDHLWVEWEKATAFAIAAMRQQNEFFDALCESHDKAYGVLNTSEPVFEARELIHSLQFTGPEFNETSNTNQSETGNFNDTHHDQNLTSAPSHTQHHKDSTSDTSMLNSTAFAQTSTDTTIATAHNTLTGSQNFGASAGKSGMLSTAELVQAFGTTGLGTIDEINDDGSAASLRDLDELPTRPVSPSFSALQDRLQELTISRDEEKIAAQQTVVNKLQLEVIHECINIENFVLDIHVVAERCIKLYNEAETRSIRQKQFEELTCMLGEGRAPTKGFTDWKEHGVKGIRPVMVRFFLAVQRLAEERITLQELETPQGRHLHDKIVVEKNLDKWKLLWNGHDVVLKVVHCLDFLRKCRELSEWYGPSFYFVANPLMLPFPMHAPYENKKLDMAQKVSDQRLSVPHLRLGCMNTATKSEWQHQQYLNKWRRYFEAVSADCAFNWPSVPDIREDSAMEKLYTCMLVIYTTCESTLQKSFVWEKKFISNIQSVRGQDKYLVGKNTAKVDKKLEIPPMGVRKHRPADLLNAAAHRASELDAEHGMLAAHQRSRKASDVSFAMFGYSQASSKFSGPSDLDFSDEFSIHSTEDLPQARPHLQQVMQFNTILQSAEDKVKARAAQMAALARKASVMGGGGGGRRRTSSAQHMHRASRSPSISMGGGRQSRSPSVLMHPGASGSPSRRTSSRPSTAGALGGALGGGVGSPGRLSHSPGHLSPGADSPQQGSSMPRHSILRKSSSANNNARDSTIRRESTLRKSSTVSAFNAGGNGDFGGVGSGVGGGKLSFSRGSIRKSSSSGVSIIGAGGGGGGADSNRGSVNGVLSPSMSGKFKPSFRSPSQGNIGNIMLNNNTIAEEDSINTASDEGDNINNNHTSSNAAKSRSNSVLSKPLSPIKRNTTSRGSALPVVVESGGGNGGGGSGSGSGKSGRLSVLQRPNTMDSINATTGSATTTTDTATSINGGVPLRKLSTAPNLNNTTNTTTTNSSSGNASSLTPSTSSAKYKTSAAKSIRLNMLAPTLAEGSETSIDSPGNIATNTTTATTTKKRKTRKQSTTITSGVTAEPSLDNTTVSLALASPHQSPKQTRKRTTINKRASSPLMGAKTSPTGTPEEGKKKRNSILDKSAGSNVVTRLPPVQGNVRLTRRKDA